MTSHKPVFYDASGKRLKISIISSTLFALAIVAAITIFVWTILSAKVPEQVKLNFERPSPLPIEQQINRVKRNVNSWIPIGNTNTHKNVIRVAFYVPWDDASYASLKKHISDIDWLVSANASIDSNYNLKVVQDNKISALFVGQERVPAKFLMVQNITNQAWDSKTLSVIITDKKRTKDFLEQVVNNAKAGNYQGVTFDFENLRPTDIDDYVSFLKKAKVVLKNNKLVSTATVPLGDNTWDLKKFNNVCDKIFLMAYDENWIGGPAGPIASQNWFITNVKDAIEKIGKDKSIVAIGNYAYDWPKGQKGEVRTVEEAWLIAHDSDAKISFDQQSGNSTFSYKQDGIDHTVWLLDATSGWNELQATKSMGAYGIALWRLGSEDSTFWNALQSSFIGKLPDLSTLSTVGDVDVEGNGEVFQITDIPTLGHRDVVFDRHNLAINANIGTLPTPYVITKRAGPAKELALTFDDGPDPKWTPKILEILKKENVNATFFIIGENAVSHPSLLNRMLKEGNELGNHSYTHPNLANDSKQGTKIEINTTQRLVEAYTQRSMRLFRAPYFGDAEPTTPDELEPALHAQQLGYINVGLHVDPNDWKRPGVDNIINSVMTQVNNATDDHSEQIILLHDSGGERQQTVEALPIIIEKLKAQGYKFVTVSQLMGIPRDQAMPILKGDNLAAVRTDIAMFLTIAFVKEFLKVAFVVAITLGIIKALTLTILALKENAKPYNPPQISDNDFLVSVIIPAYNEEKVIKASIDRVLETEGINFEIIIANDGSKDSTAKIVMDNFGTNPLVTLLNMENGGKASAVNQALQIAKGDIIVTLDADTQFEAYTIQKLVRWFKDEKIGAVAGNARVGNEINLVTKWQAIEYITAQNLERRALSYFDAITVVPGAVGAWRKKALEDVGYYPKDTLAEDQDLTIAIQRKGWKVMYDDEAVAWTEAPESFGELAKQRFRWSYGTLQCLWKHREIYKQKPKDNIRGLAYFALPQAWVFQIIFAVISPLIDFGLILSIVSTIIKVSQHGLEATHSDILKMAVYWICFVTIDIGCGFIAYKLEPIEAKYRPFLMLLQRFFYRQIMYGVVIRAVSTAITGLWTGWGRLERSGNVNLK